MTEMLAGDDVCRVYAVINYDKLVFATALVKLVMIDFFAEWCIFLQALQCEGPAEKVTFENYRE